MFNSQPSVSLHDLRLPSLLSRGPPRLSTQMATHYVCDNAEACFTSEGLGRLSAANLFRVISDDRCDVKELRLFRIVRVCGRCDYRVHMLRLPASGWRYRVHMLRLPASGWYLIVRALGSPW